MKYLTIEQLRTNLSLGHAVAQWLSFERRTGYTVLKWVSLYKERDLTYSTCYIECFDDGHEGFTDIVAFSSIDPDEPIVFNTFDELDDALNFAVTAYAASLNKFVTSGMIEEEYKDYLKTR